MADDVSEGFSEWQQIPSPSSPNSPPIVEHEDSSIHNTTQQFQETTLSLPNRDDNNDGVHDKLGEGNYKWLKKNLRELSSWFFSKMRNYGASCKVGIGTFTSKTSRRILAVVFVSLFCVMLQRWRRQKQLDDTPKKFVLLIKEKDQKIDQLLLQICQMNDLLLARRKVPVLRVG